jgi:ATP-dependent Clp endopeptidase proteolytic subunit ClpP
VVIVRLGEDANAEILLHRFGGVEGQATDIEIQAREVISVKRRLEEIIALRSGSHSRRSPRGMDRDYFLSAEEAKEYGIIDRDRSPLISENEAKAPTTARRVAPEMLR